MFGNLSQLPSVRRALVLLCFPALIALLLLLRTHGNGQVALAPAPQDLSGTKITRSIEKQIGKTSSGRVAVKRAELRVKRQNHRRQSTPRARAERKRSRTAYKHLSAEQAREAVATKQPQIVDDPAWEAPELQPGAKLVGYADANTARIDMPGSGPDAFVASTREPIALPAGDGILKAIDLKLRATKDGLEPVNSRVPLVLPERVSAGISFGDNSGEPIKLSLGGSSARASLIGNGKKAFYANTRVDSDTVIEAVPLGAEVSWTLRSPASPSSLPMDFSGPVSQFKMLADGSASFETESLGEGFVSTPIAWDAQGRSVKTKLVITRSGVSVEVAHLDAAVAYPIVVDPAVTYGGVVGIRDDAGFSAAGDPKPLSNGGGALPFGYSASTANMVYASTAQDSGYQMKILVNTSTTGSQYANLMYDAPRTASIFRVSFANVAHVGAAYTTLRIGLINSGGAWEGQRAGWYGGTCTDPNGCFSPGPYFENASGMASSTVDACATTSCGLGGSPDNRALLQLLYNRTGGAPSVSPYVQTRGAYVYYSDYTAPTLDFGEVQNLPATGWGKNTADPTFRALVTDTGLGVGDASLSPRAGYWYAHASAFDFKVDGVSPFPISRPANNGVPYSGVGPGCIGGWSSQCPLTYERPGTVVPLQEGIHTYDFTGADIVGNKTTHSYVFRTDRSAPEVDLSGRLGAFALDSAALGSGEPRTIVDNAPFVIQAFDGRRKLADGSPSSPKDHRSGVKLLSAKIYGSNADGSIDLTSATRDFDAENSPAGPKASDAVACDPARAGNDPDVNNSCKLSYGGTFNAKTLNPGIYYFRVHAEDYAGNASDKDFKVAVGIASLNTVVEGDSTSRYVPVQVKRESGSAALATIQYRTALTKRWCDVDVVTNGSPGAIAPENAPKAPAADDVAIATDGNSANYILDLDSLRGIKGVCQNDQSRLKDGKVYVRALMSGTGPTASRASEDVTIQYQHGGLGSQDATQQIGPGSLDLVTGNFSMSATDASVDAYRSDLTVTRTYNSRYYAQSGPLGPGWKLGIESDAAGADYVSVTDNADVRIPDEERYPSVDVETSGGDFLSFELTEVADKYRAEDGSESLELQRIPDAADSTRTAGFKIFDRDSGTVTTFRPMTGAEDAGSYELNDVYQPGASDQITYSYANYPVIGGVVRYAFAPAAGLTCRPTNSSSTQSFDDLPRGCQALRFNYNARGAAAEQRLTSIDMKAWDPAQSSMKLTSIANYNYDDGGRLVEEWDPRITPALKTTYTVLTGNESGLAGDMRISSVAPPGEDPFVINYLKLTEDDGYGRVNNVQRTPAGGSTSTWTPRYYVPTQGSGAPFDFSATEVSKWGQAHPPFIAAALFAPDQPPNGSPATNFDRASITYMDPLGRAVNTREPGDRVTTTEYDKWGEITRKLGAENRARALAESTPAARVAAAQKWDSENEYASVPGSLDSRRHLTRSVGPEHQVRLEDGTWVQARTVSDFSYDEGSPIAGDNTKEPFDLVTKQTESALYNGTLKDSRTTKTEYGTSEDDWKLRVPRLTTTDPDGLQIKQKVTVDTDGNVSERFQPRSQASGEPSSTKLVYYSALPNAATPECGSRPEWLGLPCKRGPGAQPTTAGLPMLPEQTITYNYLRQPLVSTESVVAASGSTKTRTSTKTYDEAGRVISEEMTGSIGTTLDKVTHVYSTATGRETRTTTGSGTSTPKSVVRVFDSLGRQTNYTDAEGHASSVTYDILSRPVTMSNEKSTRTNYFDALTGDLVYASDSAAGDFVGVYDADARLVGTVLPGGIVKTFTFDTTGTATYTAYSRGSGCSTNCLIYQQSGLENAHGQYSGLMDDTSGQDSTLQYYDYDAAGRLRRVQDNRTTSGTTYCTQREYSLDADSNRLSKTARLETAGQCAQTGGTTQTNTYDNADRITSAGYVYDAFGRITSAPGADTGGSSAFDATYFVNDFARSITQDGVTQTLDLDPMRRMSLKTTTSSGPTMTESYAYTDDSDSPTFTQKGAAWNRTVYGIAGAEAAQDSSSGVKLLIQNLRGDVVAQSTTQGVLSGFSRVDEFGVPKAALPGDVKYAFHGSKQREALTSGGVIAMGVRLYQPQMGRFLQVDPVLGGTANSYEYPSDPINSQDLDGRRVNTKIWLARKAALKFANFLQAQNAGKTGVIGIYGCGAVGEVGGLPAALMCGLSTTIAGFKVSDVISAITNLLSTNTRTYGVYIRVTGFKIPETGVRVATGMDVHTWNPKQCFPVGIMRSLQTCERTHPHSTYVNY
jgi:RHS repeat-associated protein